MGGQQIATEFSLPGVVGGELERVNVGSQIGTSVVVLVFYPSNFGPQSGQSAALLRAVDDLTSEADATGIGLAPESVYSHQRFADEAGIGLPLASDADGTVADDYDVAATGESGQPLADRSVFVVDYRGVIVTEWTASHAAEMPDFQQLRSQLRAITPDRSARGCYRVGYARYREARRHLSKGLEHCEAENWGLASSAFTEACQEFGNATDLFTNGQGLAEDEAICERNSHGRVTATNYWEAAEWLAGFATASGKGNAETRMESREAAERVLRDVRDETLPEPAANDGISVSDSATA